MRALVINDVHVADKAPIGRTDQYTEQVFAKLEECRELAEGCNVTLMTGDLFHSKRPSYVSHRLVQRLIDLFSKWPTPVISIVGNHDLSEEGLSSIRKQPIGVLFEAGAIQWLKEDTVTTLGDVRVHLSPANYVDNIDRDVSLYSMDRDKDCDLAIKIAHGAVVPPKKTFQFETTQMDKIDTTGIDILLFGHLHWDTGIKVVNGCVFAGLGSLSRVSRHDIDRMPRVLIFDVSKDQLQKKRPAVPLECFTPVTLKSTVSSDVAFLPMAAEHVIDKYDSLQSYASQLASSIQRSGVDTTLDDLIAGLAANVSKAVERRVKAYLEEAGYASN